MSNRIGIFIRALRSSRSWQGPARPMIWPQMGRFACRSCQQKFSTSSIFRQVQQAAKRAIENAAKKGGTGPEKSKTTLVRSNHWLIVIAEYPASLVIYNAGDMRTSWFIFWKATAIFQFSVFTVFFTPLVFKNEAQPDPNIRLLEGIGCRL